MNFVMFVLPGMCLRAAALKDIDVARQRMRVHVAVLGIGHVSVWAGCNGVGCGQRHNFIRVKDEAWRGNG